MIKLPKEQGGVCRILSIDPGTDTLGVCVIEVDLTDYTPTLLEATTYRGSRAIIHDANLNSNPHIPDRFARNLYHMYNVESILRHYGIHYVVYETAYMGKFATAYEGLVECLTLLRMAVRRYDELVPMYGVPTKNAKKSIGAKQPRKKPEVMEAIDVIVNTGKLKCTPSIVRPFDEHTSDAIAVGWHFYTRLVDILKKGDQF